MIRFKEITWSEKLQNIQRIRDALVDEKSKVLFDARIDYMIDRDVDKYCSTLKR